MGNELTFQDAITKCNEWIRLWDKGEMGDQELADAVGEVIQQREGSRGFFVASLTNDSNLMDQLPKALLTQLQLGGDGIVDLTVRNLAMSTAMEIHHGRNQDQDLTDSSRRVQRRSQKLLLALNPKAVKERLETMNSGLDGKGDDKDFISRWEYDDEQRNGVRQVIETTRAMIKSS
ncbi:MAG: hypothetical protein ACKOOH_09605 [Cyanobium sp.]